MWKKFLAAFAAISVLTTSIYAQTPSLSNSSIDNFELSRTVFEPGVTKVGISYDLDRESRIYAYVIEKNGAEVEYVFENDNNVSAGTVYYSWHGTEDNEINGTGLPEGDYEIKVFAYDSNGAITGYEVRTVEIDYDSTTNPDPDKPRVADLEVDPDEFDPRDGERTDISFDIEDERAYVTIKIKEGNSTKRTFNSFYRDLYNEGSFTQQWAGTDNSGNYLDDGLYTVEVVAEDVETGTVDVETTTVRIETETSNSNGPDISDLEIDPDNFDPRDENADITFSVDEDADITVEIRDGSEVVREFSAYKDDFYVDGDHTINWSGRDDDGEYLEDGTYTVRVFVENSDGSDVSTVTFEIDEDGSTGGTDGDIIKDFELNPSNTWDPAEEDLEIEFELDEDVDDLEIYAERGNKKIEIYDDRNADDGDYEETWEGTDDDDDYVDEGIWTIVVEADGDRVSDTIEVEYEKPEIVDAFVTKDSIDTDEDEFTYVVFKVDHDALVTVEVYDGNDREEELWEEEEVEEDRWYAVRYDENGDEGNDWEFRITAEPVVDVDDIEDVERVDFEIEEDDVSSRKANITNDYTDPVITEEDSNETIEFNFCLDEDAEVYLGVYEGESTGGSADAELLDYLERDAGCHTVRWNGKDDNNRNFDEGIASYKLISRTSSSSKDTETGKFVFGDGERDSGNGGNGSNGGGYGSGANGDCDNYYWDVNSVSGEMCDAIAWVTENEIFEGYNNGSFGPFQNINRAETLKVVLEVYEDNYTMLPANGSDLGFRDVDPDAWYMSYARTAKFYGILHGYLNQTEARFNNSINRVEFLKFALEAADAFVGFEMPGYNTTDYADVDEDEPTHDWFFDYAGFAYEYELYDTRQVGTRTYLDPANNVKRGEVALLLYRMNKAGLL